jgi:hypothetical protein
MHGKYETLELARIMDEKALGKKSKLGDYWCDSWCANAATELRRLHESNTEILEVLNKLEYSYGGSIKRYPEEAEVNTAIAKATKE